MPSGEMHDAGRAPEAAEIHDDDALPRSRRHPLVLRIGVWAVLVLLVGSLIG